MKSYVERLKKKIKVKSKTLIVFIILIVIFRSVYIVYIFNFKYIDGKDKSNKEVMVIELKEVKENKISYLVRYDKNNFLINIYNRAGESVDKEEFGYFKYGDKIRIHGKINIPKLLNNPNEFNYKRYLNSKKIVGYINTYSVSKVGEKVEK